MRQIVLISLILLTFKSFSQSFSPILKQKDWEKWQDRVPVGAEFSVGVMDVNTTSKINPTNFYVKIPQSHSKFLCVSVNSIDGKYKAVLEYDISSVNKAGVFQFNIPTRYQEKLIKYREQEVAIIVRTEANCSSSTGDHFIASWHDLNLLEKVVVYINSESPVILKLSKGKEVEDIKCKKIYDTDAISFNCECEIPIDKIKKYDTINLMKVMRTNTGPKPKKHGEISIKI